VRGVHGQTVDIIQRGRGGRSAISTGPGGAVAGDGGDDAARLDHADALVAGIGDEDVAAGVHGHRFRGSQRGRGRGAAVAAVAIVAVAGDGDDIAVRLDHHADALIAGIGDVDVAAGVRSDPTGARQLGVAREAAVAGEARGAVPGEGEDGAGRFQYFADAV